MVVLGMGISTGVCVRDGEFVPSWLESYTMSGLESYTMRVSGGKSNKIRGSILPK